MGDASVQYGPGTQVAAYWLMRHVKSFSVVGFREAWPLFVWAGVSVLFAVFFLAFGYLRGLAVSLLSALVYPVLHLLGFQPGGSYSGYFGWASPLRYVGLITLVLLLFSGSASWRAVRTALIAVLGGFLLIWVPVLAYYAVQGQLVEFIQQNVAWYREPCTGCAAVCGLGRLPRMANRHNSGEYHKPKGHQRRVGSTAA